MITNPIPTQPETLERVTVCANCDGKLYQNADPNNIHWYHEGSGDVRCPTRFAERRAAVTAPRGDMEKQARDLVDAFRYASPPVQSLRFLEWEPLVIAIADALLAATSSPTPAAPSVVDAITELIKMRDEYADDERVTRPVNTLNAAIERLAFANSNATPAERTRVEGEQESAMKTIDWLGDMEVRHIGPLEAKNRDKAQEIIVATEAALGEKFDSIARHELVNQITVALTAAAPADNDAESKGESDA